MSDFSNQDMFDSRTVEDRIEELESLIPDPEDSESDTDDEPLDPEEQEEYAALVALRDDVGSREWPYGITFIADSYFEEYAQDFADETGILSDVGGWPFTCIDWEQAARELQYDYSSVELDGETYWFLA